MSTRLILGFVCFLGSLSTGVSIPLLSSLQPLGEVQAAITFGAQFGTPKEVCTEEGADAICESTFGTACTQVGGSCSWCETPAESVIRKCTPTSEQSTCERVLGGAGGVDCGTRFNGTCVTISGTLTCHGTPAGTCNSGGSLQHECN